MAATTAAVIGIGSGIATSIQGFNAASTAKTAQQNADNEAKRMMMNARKRAEQNEYGELSLPLEAYEAEFEADAREQQKQQLISMDVGEAKMQDQKAREAAEARRMSIESGFQGIGQVAQGVGDLAPLYGRSMNDKRAQGLVGNNKFLQGMGVDPSNLNYEQRMALMDKVSGVEISGQQYRQGLRNDFEDFDFSIFNQ